MSTTPTNRTPDELSSFVHTWETRNGDRVFFDTARMSVVKTDATDIEHALEDEAIRQQLKDAGMLTEADSPTAEQPTAEQRWEPLRNVELNTLYIVLNRDCNFDCGYCFLPPEHRRIDPDDARRAIELLDETDRPFKHIVFYGGEPLISFDLIRELVAETGDEWGYSLATNGSLIDEEIAQFFVEHDFKVSLSVDGPPEIHDQVRRLPDGSGTYARVVRGARHLEHAGQSYQVMVTVNEHNTDRLTYVVDYLDREFEHEGISLNFPCLSGRGDVGPTSGVTPEELADAWIGLIDAYSKGSIDVLPTNIYNRWIRPLSKGVPAELFCGGCQTHAIVSPDGRLGPCMAADTHPESDVEVFWRDLDELDSIEAYENSQLAEDWQGTLPIEREECRNCHGFGVCGGGCPYDGYSITGEIETKDPRYCQFVRTVVKEVVERWA